MDVARIFRGKSSGNRLTTKIKTYLEKYGRTFQPRNLSVQQCLTSTFECIIAVKNLQYLQYTALTKLSKRCAEINDAMQ